MAKKLITGEGLPKAVGPYSVAVETDGWVFVSGQIPKDPKSGEMKQSGIEEATAQCLENVKAILKAAGTDFNHVVKATVFMVNLNDFQKMNAVYEKYLGESKPARAAVQVARLPADAIIEIECVAKK